MMQERFRSTFYKHCTLAMHVRDFEWNEQTAAKVGGEILTGCDRELVRASVLMKTARCYWPTELVERFVVQNWRVICLTAHADGP